MSTRAGIIHLDENLVLPSGDFDGKPAMLLGADLLSRYRLL